MDTLLAIISRDMKLAFRRRGGIVYTLVFCLMLVTLFPLALGVEPGLMQRIGTGIIWVASLMVSTLNLPQLFEDDFEDGSLEMFVSLPQSLGLIALAKIIAHWCVSGMPLALFSPLLAILFGIDSAKWIHLALSLALGTFLLTLIGALASALSLGVRKAWLLLSLLALPLNVPVLIFGTAVLSDVGKQGYMGLVFLLMVLFPITLYAATQALKAAVHES